MLYAILILPMRATCPANLINDIINTPYILWAS